MVDGRTARAGGQRGGGEAEAAMPGGGSKEWERDMEACCRKICTILKEDCKVGGRGSGTDRWKEWMGRPEFFFCVVCVLVDEACRVWMVYRSADETLTTL